MSSESRQGDGTPNAQELKENAFVEKLIPDPSKPAPAVAIFEGLLGRSADEAYWRLYFTTELNSYVEFKQDDVLSGLSIPKEQSRLGVESTKVWIRRDATIAFFQSQSAQAGEVSAESMPGVYEPRVPVRTLAALAGDGGLDIDNYVACLIDYTSMLEFCEEWPDERLRRVCRDGARNRFQQCVAGTTEPRFPRPSPI